MKRRLVLGLLLASLGPLAPSASATAAGSYQVLACNFAPEEANNSWTWASSDPSEHDHYAKHESCPYRLGASGGKIDQESGLSTTDALGLSNGAPRGTSAGWTFTAPATTTITGLTYERYIGHVNDPYNDWAPALRADGNVVPGESCLDSVENGESCFVGDPPGHGAAPATITGLSAHQLTLGIVCQAPPEIECITGATLYHAWAAMYGAKVTLTDPTPPALGTPSGPLWEPTATGYHKGSESLAVGASDEGGGVQSLTLAVDGQPLQTYTLPCDFTHPQPCPLSTPAHTFIVPTGELADGTHTLTLTATDAAGNTTSTSEQITTANQPPPPPSALAATPTQPGSATFTATWTLPTGQVAPITAATFQICPITGTAPCTTPAAAPATGSLSLTAPGAGSWTLAVWLTNAAGNSSPLNAAYTTLLVPTPTGAGAPQGSGPSTSPPGTGQASGTTTPGTVSSPSSTRLRMTVRLHGRRLFIWVSGPSAGRVRLSYRATLHGKTITHTTRVVTLRDGRVTTTFNLPLTGGRAATVLVTAAIRRQTLSRVVRYG
jgi:hypothetical protein